MAVVALAAIAYLVYSNKSVNNTTENAVKENWEVYTNTKYKFSIQYPNDWQMTELQDGSGASFSPKANAGAAESIIVEESGRAINSCTTPFDEYVKIAATENIQNYEALNSIETIATDGGANGYKTTWKVTSLAGKKFVSTPISYFLDEKSKCSNSEGLVTVTLDTADGVTNYSEIYNEMLQTFTLD